MLQENHQKITDELNSIAGARSSHETKKQTSKQITVEHRDVFQTVLNSLETFDFHTAAALDKNEPITQKILIVLTVAEVLRLAAKLNLGICRLADFVYTFNGIHWKPAEKSDLEMFLGQAALKMGVNVVDANFYKFREHLLKQFLAVAQLPLPAPPENTVLVNLQNGTFEISKKSISLREHRREDFLKYALPFDYDERAKCPKWTAFLNHVLPDKSAQDVLAEFIGYVFTSGLKLEIALILFGNGSNGKSVVHDVINALLGRENVSNYSLKNLGEEHNRAQIVNKLLNYSSEINSKIEADTFKQLVSGEPVQARLKYGQSFIAERYAKLMFNANELPSDVEHTRAYFRRFVILPFETTISDEQKNPNLAQEIIAAELSGVFNWVLDGLRRLLKQQAFSKCAAAERMVEQFRLESDSVASFVAEECAKHGETKLSDLYFDYKNYCIDNGRKAVGKQKFAKRLELIGVSRIDSNQPKFLLTRRAE